MIRIRQATANDLEAIVVLNNQIFINNTTYNEDVIPNFSLTPQGKEYFKKALEKSECFLIAEEDDRIIGYTNGERKLIPHHKSKYFEIANIGVLPEKEGSGIGKQLLESIISWAKQHYYQKICLDCYAKNTRALAFYKRNNFTQTNIILEKDI